MSLYTLPSPYTSCLGIITRLRGTRLPDDLVSDGYPLADNQGTVAGSQQGELFGAAIFGDCNPHVSEVEVAHADATFGAVFCNPIATIELFVK